MKGNSKHAWPVLLALCVAFIVAGGVTSCSSPQGGPGEGWTEDFDAASKRAKDTGRPLLLNFTGSDWCPPCKRLHREVFDTDEFRAYAMEDLVPVTIDFPRRRQLPAEIKNRNFKLQNKYKISGYPTIIILDASGKELGRPRYRGGGPSAFIEEIRKITGK